MQTVTMAEARKRWADHTRHVISDEAIAAAKRSKEWAIAENGVPVLTLGGEFRLEFLKASGHIFARLNGAAKTYPPTFNFHTGLRAA